MKEIQLLDPGDCGDKKALRHKLVHQSCFPSWLKRMLWFLYLFLFSFIYLPTKHIFLKILYWRREMWAGERFGKGRRGGAENGGGGGGGVVEGERGGVVNVWR